MSARLAVEDKKLPQKFVLPPDFVNELTKWENEQAALWVLRHGLSEHELRLYDIGYSVTAGGIVYPLKDKEDIVLGYQVRNFENPEGPKYVTHRLLKNSGLAFYSRKFYHSYRPTVCVVEDILSAIKVDRVMPAVAILSSHAPDHVVGEIAMQFESAVVFLDNDNQTVKLSQKTLCNRLEALLNGKVNVIQAKKDPKAHSETELRQLLGKYA